MMTRDADKKREQMLMFCMDDMVPKDHLLRIIDKAIDWNFIYDLVEERYSIDQGRPSLDPVLLIKIVFIQYLYGIKSMRQTIKEIEVNVAYRWFLGLDMLDAVPHFSTFGKNYTRRFKDTDLFEQIFSHILEQCLKFHLIDTDILFIDSTHVKACANNKKARKRIAHQEALWYEKELKKEINEDRKNHGKNPLKDNNDDDKPSPPLNGKTKENENPKQKKPEKEEKCSITDPDSGWFHKGEHKQVFAYGVQTACDCNGWVLGYTVHPGNYHDSRTFIEIYQKIQKYHPQMLGMDSGYKTPAIAHRVIEDGIKPLFPYKRPQTKKGFFKKNDFVYDEYYDCYICPENKLLLYSTTNRNGYKEYKSNCMECVSCPSRNQCTKSKDYTKVVIRHVWEEYLELSEDIRHTRGNKEIYDLRKETIERIFGTIKEYHGFRYTQYIGKARMQMKAGITFACTNLKKLAKILQIREEKASLSLDLKQRFKHFYHNYRKTEKRCWSFTPTPTLSTL